MREYVYFIGHEEAVKIGYTTTSVNKRNLVACSFRSSVL